MIPLVVFALVLAIGFATMAAMGAASRALAHLLIAFALMIAASVLIAWPFLRRR